MITLVPMHPGIHFLFESLAYFAGFRLFAHLRKQDPISTEQRNWVLVGCIVGAVLGAKAIVWLEDPGKYFSHELSLPVLLAGKSIAGALVGGLAGVELIKKCIGLKQATGDLLVYPLILGIIVGRIGCLLGGYYDQTYGTPTSLPWGVDFGDGISRHPTQLYEILFLLGLAGVIHWRKQSSYIQGQLFQWFMVGYFAFRLAVEFIKPVPHVYWGLNSIQLLSLGVLVYYGHALGIIRAKTVRESKY